MRYHLFLIASDFLATNYACATLLRGASVITLPQSKSSQPILSKQLYHNVNDNKKYNDDHAATALEDITACPDSKNAVDLMLDDSDAIGNVWITNSYHHSRAENASRRVPKEKTCVNMSIDQKRIASKLEAVYIYYKCTPPPQERNRQEAIYFNHHFDLHDYSSLTSTWCLETLECDHNDDFFGAKSNGYIAFHAQFDSNDQNQKESKTLMNTENKFSLDLKRDMLRHRRGQVVDASLDTTFIPSVDEEYQGVQIVRDKPTFDVYSPGSTGPGESTTVTVQKPPPLRKDPLEDTPIALEVSDGPIVENVVNNVAVDGDTPVFDAYSEGGQISPDSSSPEVVLTVVEPTTDGEGSPVSESIATVVDENLRITDPGPDSVILDTYPNGISNTGGGDTTEDKTPIASVSEGNLGLVNVRDDLTFDVYTPGSTGPGESTTVTVQKPPSLVVDPPDDTPIALEVSDGPIVENVVNNEAADGDTPVFDADSEGGQISPDSSSPEVVLTVVEPTTEGEVAPEIVTQTDVLNLNVPVEIETPDVADPELTIVGDGENEALPVILDVFPPENVVVDDEPAEDPPEYRPLPMDAEPEPVSEIGVELDSDGCFSPGAADPSAISQAVEELSDETMLGVQYRAMRSARKDSLVTINGLFGMSGYRAWSLDSDHPMCVNCLYPFDVHSSYKDDYSDITRPGGINNVDNLPAANWLINKYPVNTTLSNDDNLCPVNVPGTPVVTWNIFQTAIWKLIDMGYHRIARCNGACQDAADALVTCALDQGNDYEPVCCQETLGLLLIWDHDVTGALSKKELMVEVPMSDIPGACPGGSRNRRFLEEDTSPVYSAALSATSTASAHFSNSVSSNGGTYYCQNNV